jgi:F-type H+-transporting ATPase subunit a
VLIFLVVQFYGVKEHGVGYLKHFLEGLPSPPPFRSTPLYKYLPLVLALTVMGGLIFAIHVVGEFVRPVSLALRLFGNIHGEETVIVVLVGLVAVTKFWFVPIQLPNLALGLLTALVQALVMSLLAAVYLSGVLQHEAEAEHG